MHGNTVLMKKELLQVNIVCDSKGKHSIEWKYGHNIEAYQLIGILESIKLDLLDRMDDNVDIVKG